MKTIITALDFKGSSEKILNAAIELAKNDQASLHIIHVVEFIIPYTAYGMMPEEFPSLQKFQQDAETRASENLEKAKITAQKTVGKVITKLIIGLPLYAIVDYVENHQANYLVIGTHSHGVISSLLIGSIADGLVRKAICPTLIIPHH
jgi:nucleotide-binding universal stress UspA family protein